MKTILLLLGAGSMLGGDIGTKPPNNCPHPKVAAKDGPTRFDPLLIDLKGDGKRIAVACTVSTAGAAETAGKETKPLIKAPIKVSASQNGQTLREAVGPGGGCDSDSDGDTVAAGRAAADHAINTKGTGAAGRVAAVDHAINTKGTGATGRVGARPAPREALLGADACIQPTTSGMAIKTKGTGAQ